MLDLGEIGHSRLNLLPSVILLETRKTIAKYMTSIHLRSLTNSTFLNIVDSVWTGIGTDMSPGEADGQKR